MARTLQSDGRYLDDNGFYYTSFSGGNPIIGSRIDLTADADTYTITNPGGTLAAKAVFGQNGNDTIQGDSSADLIYGNRGLDSILGGAGNDTIFGGQNDSPVGTDGFYRQGVESIMGGSGNDILYGNHGSDILSGGVGDDALFGGQDNDSLSGGFGNDTMYGNRGNDFLLGGFGNDVLYGNAGTDTLDGDYGNDTYYINPGDSGTVYYNDNSSDPYTDILHIGAGSSVSLLRSPSTGNTSDYTVTNSGQTLTITSTGQSSDTLNVLGEGDRAQVTIQSGPTYQYFETSGSWILQ